MIYYILGVKEKISLEKISLSESLGPRFFWFGILFILNCGMAYITPLFGFNLFYPRAFAPADCTMGEIHTSVWP
jgi:TRAP-type mannitol/chloroaromatic compound transport system permease large subunit